MISINELDGAQKGHGFLSLVNARQNRQFIPQGAISFVEITVAFADLFDVITISGRSYVSPSILKAQQQGHLQLRDVGWIALLGNIIVLSILSTIAQPNLILAIIRQIPIANESRSLRFL